MPLARLEHAKALPGLNEFKPPVAHAEAYGVMLLLREKP